MKNIEVVAAIIEYERKVLCCQREGNALSYLSEKWEFPGGKIERGESREEALVREIREELGMVIYDCRFAVTVAHLYDDFHLTMHAFHASTAAPGFDLHAHRDATWASVHELDGFEWAAADVPIVDYLKDQAAL